MTHEQIAKATANLRKAAEAAELRGRHAAGDAHVTIHAATLAAILERLVVDPDMENDQEREAAKVLRGAVAAGRQELNVPGDRLLAILDYYASAIDNG